MSVIKELLDNDVVVLWSGGPDSTGLIHLLLSSNYKGCIYPLFINRGQRNQEYEKKSILYYSSKFKTFDRFKDWFEVNSKIPPKEFDNFNDDAKYAIRNSDIINQGVRYAIQNNIKTVLLATFENENQFNDGSKNYLEAKTKEVQVGTNLYNFTIFSPFHNNKFPQSKSELIKICSKKLDLSNTRSCYEDQENHCGECKSCKNRHSSFMEALGKDKTTYDKISQTSYEHRPEKIQ